MATSSASTEDAVPLPPDFRTIEDIRNLSNEAVVAGTMVNVIGFAKDYQPPVLTRGSDYKCTIEIKDHSTRYETFGMKINIFWKLNNMPAVSVADVIVVRKAKVQMWNGAISLIAHSSSEFHVISSSMIPTRIADAHAAQWRAYPSIAKSPTPAETSYVIWANNRAADLELPSKQEFEHKKEQSINLKDKFSLLKDVKPGRFYNLLGQVIKVVDLSGRVALYLTDYTAHTQFYNYAFGGEDSNARDGDEYGYTKNRKNNSNEWPGPYGKLTIQLTLYDNHAGFVRESVKIKEWVLLSNVQINHGKTGGLLEGFLRGDRGSWEGKTQVRIMKPSENREDNDPRFKAAVKRMDEYDKKFKAQMKRLAEDSESSATKRKHGGDGDPRLNSKQRRKERRAATDERIAASQAKLAQNLNLNENNQPVVSLRDVLRPEILLQSNRDQQNVSAFTLRKYRANVRVIDYFPNKLEDFAIGRRASERDMLSDYSGSEDTDLEEDMRIFKSGKGFAAKNIWEWRFALQVEDASEKGSKERLWLMIDNHAAQGLLNLEDNAANLRTNPKLLSDLKEQLFKLWGDLEEKKSATLQQTPTSSKQVPTSTIDSIPSSPPRHIGAQPDTDSEAENESRVEVSKNSKSDILKERNPNLPLAVNGLSNQDAKGNIGNLMPRNKAFTCCIKQYGVKVEEEDPEKANAGEGQRWQRMFALFGTQIH